MKTIASTLSDHFGQEVTTLCFCWKLVRTDGYTLGFTSHDDDLIIDGITYDSTHTFTKTAIASNSDMSVDNLDVTGVLDADRIVNQDLRNGLYNFASVYVFVVNWADLTQGVCPLRRGWLGEVTVLQNGSYHAELRGLTQALSHDYIESFTPECRADFCDARCKLNLADFSHDGVVKAAASRTVFTTASFPDVTGSTSVGAHKKWRIKNNTVINTDHAGFAEIKFWDQDGNLITGGDTTASTEDKNHGAGKARDGTPDTNWSTAIQDTDHPDNITNSYWVIEWSDTKDIKEFEIIATKNFSESPTSFNIEYSDDDGTTWHFGKICSMVWTAGGQSAIWAFGSPTQDPINFPTTPGVIPPPFTGASTYIGGTIRWTSGRNAGRTIEIIDSHADTGVITLFDSMAFDIQVGDRFSMAQGCDKRRETCQLYNNVVNMRAEPDVPGQDAYLQYPDAS